MKNYDNATSKTKYGRSLRNSKEVQITFYSGEFDYIYIEYSNGSRIQIVRPAFSKTPKKYY